MRRYTMSNVEKRYMDKVAWDLLKNNTPIVDLACGAGRFIEKDPCSIIGLERNEKSYKAAKAKGYNVIQGDILQTLPFEDKSVGGVHISHVLEHLFPEQVYHVLCEADRILRDDGFLVIRTPYMHARFYDDLDHIKPYNPSCFRHYLSKLHDSTTLTYPRLPYCYEEIHFENRKGDTAYLIAFRKTEERPCHLR